MKLKKDLKMLRRDALLLERRGKIVKAKKPYSRAANRGDLRARKKLKLMQRAEEIWHQAVTLEHRGHISEAIRLYRRGARLGNLSCMLNLGTIVDDLGPRPNAREAVYWFKRGIRAGDYTAAYNLAMHYKNRRQDRWYIHWMAVAAKMGDPDALKIVRKEAGATGKQKSKSDTGT